MNERNKIRNDRPVCPICDKLLTRQDFEDNKVWVRHGDLVRVHICHISKLRRIITWFMNI